VSKKAKNVIINADDLGLCPATNRAILDAFKKGLLTSTSLLVTCPGYRHAVKIIRKKRNIGIGLHLSLTLGKSVLSPKKIPRLANSKGLFYPSFSRLMISADKDILNQIEMELSAQIEKAIKDGLRIDHLDSHSHIHMIPHIFKIVSKLAYRYKIPYVRIAKDKILFTHNYFESIKPFFNNNIIKTILLNTFSILNLKVRKSNATFYGVYHTGFMNKNVIGKIFGDIKPGLTEVLIHPGHSVNDTNFDFKRQKMHNFMISPFRSKELDVLFDKKLVQSALDNKLNLTTFRKALKS
jgi:chitin disaccharide deacetylase